MLEQLLMSDEPIIRYKTRLLISNEDPYTQEMELLQSEIQRSTLVQTLLSDRDEKGEIPFHPYSKWQGAHWVLTCLADTGYPPGDEKLIPLREQVFGWLLSEDHRAGIEKRTGKNRQIRLHASQEANAVFASLALRLADDRDAQLVDRLLWAQWEDGGWNCDRHAHADSSSFYESITPLRALIRWSAVTGEVKPFLAAERAADIFLKRGLFRRVRDGAVMNPEFIRFRYPPYHFYDILFGLKVMAEGGWIDDPRCQEALDLLEEKQLPGGGFAMEHKEYTVFKRPGETSPRASRVNWGKTGRSLPNEFVSVDALFVLKSAGRIKK